VEIFLAVILKTKYSWNLFYFIVTVKRNMQEPVNSAVGLDGGLLDQAGGPAKRIKLEKIIANDTENCFASPSMSQSTNGLITKSKRKTEKRVQKHMAAVDRAVNRIEDKGFADKVDAFLRNCISEEIWPSHIQTCAPTPEQWRPFPEDLHPSLQQV